MGSVPVTPRVEIVAGTRREPMAILGHQAHCSCGWVSLVYQSGAQARAVETQHLEDHVRDRRTRRG